MIRHALAWAAAGLLLLAPRAVAQTCSLPPAQDNTIYSEGDLANALNEHVFAGRTGIGDARRALLRFDVAGQVPAGAAITQAELILTLTRAPQTAFPEPMSLHRLAASWGEGTSNTGLPGGLGAPATPGDATWVHRFYSSTAWAAPGGDFAPPSSATTTVGTALVRYRWSGAQLAADVQEWLDNPAASHGWILIGDETATQTARRFASRENIDAHMRPVLVVGYAPPGTASFCDASDGSLTACPCGNAGNPASGCDVAQATGGVRLDVICQTTAPANRATLRGTGFPSAGTPAAIAVRADALDAAAPVVFGDGLRCVGTPLVRMGTTLAVGGTALHVVGHGGQAGSGTRYYQVWFADRSASFCTPAGFNLSNGHSLIW